MRPGSQRLPLAAAVKDPAAWRLGDASVKAADRAFRKVRPVVLRRAGGQCAACGGRPGDAGDRLEVHHVDNNHANNAPANLAALCRYCHAVFHAGFHAQRGRGIASRWWLADRPLPAGAQAALSRWRLGQGKAPKLPPGRWLDGPATGALIAALTAEAIGRCPDPRALAKARECLLWVPSGPHARRGVRSA